MSPLFWWILYMFFLVAPCCTSKNRSKDIHNKHQQTSRSRLHLHVVESETSVSSGHKKRRTDSDMEWSNNPYKWHKIDSPNATLHRGWVGYSCPTTNRRFHGVLEDLGIFQKYWENPPKWMVKIMENPITMDDLGGPPLFFGKHPNGTK